MTIKRGEIHMLGLQKNEKRTTRKQKGRAEKGKLRNLRMECVGTEAPHFMYRQNKTTRERSTIRIYFF